MQVDPISCVGEDQPAEISIIQDEKGKGLPTLSTLSDANRDADARAFAALMRHIREADGEAHTVIMIQVENEVGVLGPSRDHSPLANQAVRWALYRRSSWTTSKSTKTP